MGSSTLITLDLALHDVTRLGFDTSPVIYFVEANPRYDALVTETFQRVADGRLAGITTTVTLLEVLVVPLRQKNVRLQAEYRDLLLHSDNFMTLNITSGIAEIAADLRARYGLKTPDALQIGCAMDSGCEAFLCNDLTLKRITELRVLILDELEL
jgi:predicted nucleic acid-binding protein